MFSCKVLADATICNPTDAQSCVCVCVCVCVRISYKIHRFVWSREGDRGGREGIRKGREAIRKGREGIGREGRG